MQKLYRWTKNYQYRDTPTLLLIFLLLQLHTSICVRIQPWWRNWSSGSNPVNGNWAWLPGLLYPPERRRWVVRASSNSHPFLPSCDVTGGERATAAPTRLTTSEATQLFLSWTPRLTLDQINAIPILTIPTCLLASSPNHGVIFGDANGREGAPIFLLFSTVTNLFLQWRWRSIHFEPTQGVSVQKANGRDLGQVQEHLMVARYRRANNK